MELISLMTKYYLNTAVRAFKMTIRNWQAALVLIIYTIITSVAVIIASRLGMLGGILLAVVSAACIGSYLYLIETILNSRIANINDFKNSFTPYLRRVMNVTFYIWIASLVYSLLILRALVAIPYGTVVNLLINLAVLVLLNPLPEFIYQTYHADLNIFRACFEFMKENFIEWMVPNVILLSTVYFLMTGGISFTLGAGVIAIIKYAAGLFILLFTMLYRGILFRFLNESTRRSRLFKLRMLR